MALSGWAWKPHAALFGFSHSNGTRMTPTLQSESISFFKPLRPTNFNVTFTIFHSKDIFSQIILFGMLWNCVKVLWIIQSAALELVKAPRSTLLTRTRHLNNQVACISRLTLFNNANNEIKLNDQVKCGSEVVCCTLALAVYLNWINSAPNGFDVGVRCCMMTYGTLTNSYIPQQLHSCVTITEKNQRQIRKTRDIFRVLRENETGLQCCQDDKLPRNGICNIYTISYDLKQI
jgi:hypothetical protein